MLRETGEQTLLSSLFSSTWEDLKNSYRWFSPSFAFKDINGLTPCEQILNIVTVKHKRQSNHPVKSVQRRKPFQVHQAELLGDTLPQRKSWWAAHLWHIQTGYCSWELQPENVNHWKAGNRCKCIRQKHTGRKIIGHFTLKSLAVVILPELMS